MRYKNKKQKRDGVGEYKSCNYYVVRVKDRKGSGVPGSAFSRGCVCEPSLYSGQLA